MTSSETCYPGAQFARDRRGAMFLMGIPICFFMIGLLYFVIGLGEGLVLRERMQDAADSGALTAAIIHARGMNLIALINILMAALVSLLIMVRMLQVLLLAAIGVASALAIPTYGASMSVVPPAAAGAEEAQAVWEELQSVIEPIVTVLHGFEVAIQYGQPAVAEIRTIAMVAKFKPEANFGVVIPGDYPLPLKDGTWSELCGRAGKFAAKLVTYPLQKILPVPPVYKAIEAASQSLSESFAPLFCGGEGSSSISIPQELPSVPLDEPISKNIPPLKEAQACQQEKPQSLPDVNQPIDPATGIPMPADASEEQARIAQQDAMKAEKDVSCRAAAQETARAQPEDDGNPNRKCEFSYAGGENPPREQCQKGACLQNDGKPCEEFQQKESLAATECKPGKKRAEPITGYNYQERQEKWVATLVPVGNCSDPDACKYTVHFETKLPEAETEVFRKNVKEPPCGNNPKGTIGTEWNTNARWQADGYHDDDYLCSQEHAKVDPGKLEAESAKTLDDWRSEFGTGWTLQNQGADLAFVGSWTAVTYIHSCESEIRDINQSQDYKDLANKYIKEQNPTASSGKSGSGSGSGSGGGCGNGEEVNLTMEDVTEDNIMGGETYQMRCIAFRDLPENKGARGVLSSVPLRLRDRKNEGGANPFDELKQLTRFFGAQAEYYFDTAYSGPETGPEEPAKDYTKEARSSWMWSMSWKARLRRLRFGSESGSSNSSSSAGSSSTQSVNSSCGTSAPSMNLDDAMSKAGGSNADSDSLGLLKTLETVIIH